MNNKCGTCGSIELNPNCGVCRSLGTLWKHSEPEAQVDDETRGWLRVAVMENGLRAVQAELSRIAREYGE